MTNIPEELYIDENHLVYEINGNWFSFTKKGNSLMVHWATRNVRKARESSNQFCNWAFETFPWCRMIIGPIKRRSVVKLAERCGFIKMFEAKDEKGAFVLVRTRP